MRRTWLLLYTGGMLVALVIALTFAVRGYQRAQHEAHWNDRARSAANAAAAIARREQSATARYAAANAEYAALAAKVNVATKALADEIARTKTTKRKVVTGSTIVSYVAVPTKAG